MTLSIDIDHFQNWSEIFREIQRQENLRFFAAIKPPSFEENEERKKKSCGRLGKETSRTVHSKLNPLNPKSDQHQISPCNINAL